MTDEHSSSNLNNNVSINSQSVKTGLDGDNIYTNRNRKNQQIQFDTTNNESIIVEAEKNIYFKNNLNGNNAEAGTYKILTKEPYYERPLTLTSSSQSFPLLQSQPLAHAGQHTIQQTESEDLLATTSPNKCNDRNDLVETSTTTTSTEAIPRTYPPKATPLPIVAIPAELSKKSTAQGGTDKAMAAAAALGSGCTAPLPTHLVSDVTDSGVKTSDSGVIDYTMNPTSSAPLADNNNAHRTEDISSIKSEKFYGHSNGGSSSIDIERDRSPLSSGNIGSGFGGRLQFFKNGKVILELARSKEGEKSRWISVPRKLFRAPSTTSSTVTPTLATSIAYSKNESSTSLSFSDDNSSIQSSPWQRDHCWKQLSPRSGISKAMSLYYQRPKSVALTKPALIIARSKRRRPYDIISTASETIIFESQEKIAAVKLCRIDSATSLKLELTSENTSCGKNNEFKTQLKSTSKMENSGIDIGFIKEEDGCSSSSTATLTGDDCIDTRMEENTPTPSSTSAPHSPCQDEKSLLKKESTVENENEAHKLEELEKMATSEDENSISALIEHKTSGPQLNGSSGDIPKGTSRTVKADMNDESLYKKCNRQDEKKLKYPKYRHKLNTIVQKLIDRVPERLAQLSRVTQSITAAGSVAGPSSNNSLLHKVSPPNTSTATRLVEYPQQHVSPRKRILREFEKVSLEDNCTVAGGKRSRAKSNASSSSASSYHSIKSPNSRNQCSANSSSPSGINATVSNENGAIRPAANTYSKSETTAQTVTRTTPTRLYSSYSIHSLLGGSGGSSASISSMGSSNTGSKKRTNDTAIISSTGYHPQQHQLSSQQHYGDPSYLRAMLAAPQSPEQCILSGGGKSPSIAATKKRSPPYVSPLRDAHSVSDIGALNNKIRYGSEHGGYIETSSTTHSASHSNMHSQKQSSYLPYMSLSKYVPLASGSATTTISSISPNSCGTAESRSPRNLSAFSRASSPASISSNIPVNHSTSSSIGNCRENSPPTSRAVSESPRDATPRTVPKKTVSIRKQFASPTTAAASSGSPSPGERHSEDTYSAQGRRTPVSSMGACGSSSHQLQRGSPSGNTIPSPLHHYYMYPPAAPSGTSSPAPHSSAVSPNTIIPVGTSGTTSAAVAAAAAAAAAASYIPSVIAPAYMNPYFALAALRHTPQMWSHYSGASLPLHLPSAASPASARLSPPAFHTFAYNGVNAAMVAVMHQQQQQQQILATSALLHGHSLSCASALTTSHHSVNASSGRQNSPSTMTERTTDSAVGTTADITTGLGLGQVAAAVSSIYPNSSKEEHSSDVPLNLSKH